MSTVAVTTRSKRASRAIELQEAREAAGFTIAGLARRMVEILRLKFPDGIVSQRDERLFIPSVAREIAFMERVTQATYDRTAEWWSKPAEERTGGRPRINIRRYDEAFQALTSGSADLTFRELRLTLQGRADAEQQARDAAHRGDMDCFAHSLAALVWNAADDPRFLDQALCAELKAEVGAPVAIRGDAHYVVRAILINLANELRTVFPDRPVIALTHLEAA